MGGSRLFSGREAHPSDVQEGICLTTTMQRCRPFKLIDSMVLIAAAGTWAALMRHWWNDLQGIGTPITRVASWQVYIGPVYNGLITTLCVLASLTSRCG